MRAFLAFIGCLLLVAVGLLGETVVHVQTGSSIQAAIDRAAPGAVIELGPGIWQENLRITRPIAITGAGADKTEITARASGYPVVWIYSPQTGSVSISGITISGAHGDSCAEKEYKVCADGILVQGKIRLELSNCTVNRNALHGLYANGTANLTIEETTFSGNYSGIWLSGSASARIDNAAITNNKFGLVLAERSSARVIGCTIAANGADGVLVADATEISLSSNRITGNGRAGVCVDEWPCYHTKRTFTGRISGERNSIPTPRDKDGNKKAAICPATLRFLFSDSGGIYPAPDPQSLFATLPVAPPMEGSPDAPVTIIEFSDFTCPYCARFARDILPKLRADYIETGKARLFFLPFPVHGKTASKEAEAGFCAQAQGKFWEFHDRMFADLFVHGFPSKFDPERVRSVAIAAGCDPDLLLSCLNAGTYAPAVQGAISIAHKLGVEGTPSFFIDGLEVFGAAPYEVFSRMIDSELVLKRAASQ